MVEVRNLRKRFGRVTAVDDVSFVAADGQITGLLGENGAGKTTTLAMIGGVLKPDAGSVHIDGADARASPDGRRHLGALLDHKGLYRGMSCSMNRPTVSTSPRCAPCAACSGTCAIAGSVSSFPAMCSTKCVLCAAALSSSPRAASCRTARLTRSAATVVASRWRTHFVRLIAPREAQP